MVKRVLLVALTFVLALSGVGSASTEKASEHARAAKMQNAQAANQCGNGSDWYEFRSSYKKKNGMRDLAIYRCITQYVRNTSADKIQVALFLYKKWKGDNKYQNLARELADKAKEANVKVILGRCEDGGSGGSGGSGCSGSGSGGSSLPSAAVKTPYEILKDSNVQLKVCKKSCLPGRQGRNHMHAKFFLFGGGGEHTVVQTGANFGSGQLTKHQDMLAVEDAGLHTAYSEYFEQMWNEEWRAGWNTDRERNRSGSGHGTRAYFYPRQKSDPMLKVLRAVDCSDGGTIKVANSQFKQTENYKIVDALNELEKNEKEYEGCTVKAITQPDDSQVLNPLSQSRSGRMHNKFLLIDAKFRKNGERRRLVYTGSHNLLPSGTYGSDDSVLRVEDYAVFEDYSKYFDKMWVCTSDSKRCPLLDKTGG